MEHCSSIIYQPLLSGKGHDELVDAGRGGIHERDRRVVELEAFGQQRDDQVLGQQADDSEDGDEPGNVNNVVRLG